MFWRAFSADNVYCIQFYLALMRKKSGIVSYILENQGAGKRPRQCCHPKGGNGAEGPKGPRTKGTVTREPEGPESGQNMRVRGPEGPEDEQS